MGFEELIGAIGAEVALQCGAIRERAEEEARALLGAAEAEGAGVIEGARSRGAEAGRAEAGRAEAARLAGRARLAARRQLLAARHQVVEAAFLALEERLRRLPAAPGYGAILLLLLEECAAGQEGPLTARCRPEDRDLLEAEARARGLRIAVEAAPLPLGGVETAGGDGGRVVCRNGFADRLEAARPGLLGEAGRILFGDGDTAAGAGPEGGTA